MSIIICDKGRMNNMTYSTDIPIHYNRKIIKVIRQYNHKKNACHATEKLEKPHLGWEIRPAYDNNNLRQRENELTWHTSLT